MRTESFLKRQQNFNPQMGNFQNKEAKHSTSGLNTYGITDVLSDCNAEETLVELATAIIPDPVARDASGQTTSAVSSVSNGVAHALVKAGETPASGPATSITPRPVIAMEPAKDEPKHAMSATNSISNCVTGVLDTPSDTLEVTP
jgi:hypothetical protein